MLIKILLLLGVGVLALWVLRNRHGVAVRAGARILLVGGLLAAVVAILFPDITQAAAEILGVTRGTDLLLYALVIVFAFFAVGVWLRFRELERRLAAVARTSALAQASATPVPPGSGTRDLSDLDDVDDVDDVHQPDTQRAARDGQSHSAAARAGKAA